MRQQCRYSLGSIALWNRAENVDLVQSNKKETFYTSRHFSYYKFYVPEDISSFTVNLSDCKVLLKTPRVLANNDSCIEYIGLRAKALPLHRPTEFQQDWRNLSTQAEAVFLEERPYEAVHYYLLVVSHGRVSFSVNLTMSSCGDSGIYGPMQQKWYLNERGLVWDAQSTEQLSKEPTTGFQLFASRSDTTVTRSSPLEESDSTSNDLFGTTSDNNDTALTDPYREKSCVSKFDFTRIVNVRAFR